MLRVAYLCNLYPVTTHAFIRREIIALEQLGVSVLRISLRSAPEDLPEPIDREELARTFIVLERKLSLLRGFAATAVRRPARWILAALKAVKLGWRSPR